MYRIKVNNIISTFKFYTDRTISNQENLIVINDSLRSIAFNFFFFYTTQSVF